MDIDGFRQWLENTPRNDNGDSRSKSGVNTVVNDIQEVNSLLGDVDTCVQNGRTMYNALIALHDADDSATQPQQMALRRYWQFRNGTEFPKLRDYEAQHDIVRH